MTLDSWLVARLAQELDGLLAGARIQSAQALPHGVTFFCYRRGVHVALHARLDSAAPLICAYDYPRPEQTTESAGWLGDVAALLRGATIEAISVVPHDRVMFVDVSSRSAFGVPSRSRVVFELQPRRTNALVLRMTHDTQSWVIVAAQKQFARSDVRRISIGSPYETPPARQPTLDRAQFIIAARDLAHTDTKAWERLLGNYDPQCTPALAKEVMHEVAQAGASEPAHAALRAWTTLKQQVEAALGRMGPVFLWRSDARVVTLHLIPMGWPSYEMTTIASLNTLCVEDLQTQPSTRAGLPREAIQRRLATLLARCEQEVQKLEGSLQRAQDADVWREAGDAIYSNLPSIAAGSSEFVTHDGERIGLDPLLTPKQNAAEYFRKYKKARSAVIPVRARLQKLRENRDYWEHLLWEVGREHPDQAARDAIFLEVAAAIGIKARQKKSRRPVAKPQHVELGEGAIAYVGRSPKDNERLTFSVAGPNDYWFHARGIPGAHVVVKSSGARLGEQQVKEAAALAAAHSRAAGATSVEVDYTRRKHVRRRGAGRTGLVWYTNFETIRVDV